MSHNLRSIIPNVLSILLLSSFFSASNAEITAESALGEYWKDPLFGEAAGEMFVNYELLWNRVYPAQEQLPLDKKIMFAFENRDSQMHIMAFSHTPKELLVDEQFKALVDDTLIHARQEKTYGNNHQHNNSDVTNPQEFVKVLEDLPLVVVKPSSRKEIVIRFVDSSPVTIFCVLDDHFDKGYFSKIIFSS